MVQNSNPFVDSFLLGIVLGIIGPFLGAIAFYFLEFSHIPLIQFIHIAYMAEILPKMLSLGGLVNLGIFFILIQVKWYWSARAVVIATFIFVIFIIVLKFLL